MRFVGMLGFLMFSLWLVGCGSDQGKTTPYSDLKAVYVSVTEAQDQLIRGIDAAQDAPKVVTALQIYTAKMRELAPQLRAVQAKYPELDTGPAPAEIQATVQALTVSTGAMATSLDKVQNFAQDQQVVAAMGDLIRVAQDYAPSKP